jgi:hypothetical protein
VYVWQFREHFVFMAYNISNQQPKSVGLAWTKFDTVVNANLHKEKSALSSFIHWYLSLADARGKVA